MGRKSKRVEEKEAELRRGTEDAGAIGGMIGNPDPHIDTEDRDLGRPAGIKDELGPFIRQIIRDEMRGLLSLHPVLPRGARRGRIPHGGRSKA